MAISPAAWFLRDNATISPVVFTGSQSTTTLTVSAVASGTLAVGMAVFTASATVPIAIITALGTGSGGTGTYTVSTSATVASTTMTAFGPQTAGSVGWSSVAAWAASTAYTAGQMVRQKALGAVITASQSSTTLTVSAATSGALAVGQTVYFGLTASTTISALGTGTGGTGTYTVGTPQTLASQGALTIFIAGNERVFVCTTAGTSGTAEPNWTLTRNSSTADNTVTWREVTGNPALNGDTTNAAVWAASSTSTTVAGTGANLQVALNTAKTHVFIVTVGGSTGATEPTWNTTTGVTTTDNTTTWKCLGAVGSFAGWAAPHARLASALGTTWAQAGDKIFAAADHAEVQPTAISITNINGTPASPNYVISVPTATIPPTSLSAGASVTTVGPNGLTAINTGNAGVYFSGITFSAGSGSTTSSLLFAAARLTLDTCVLGKAGVSSTTSAVAIGQSAGGYDSLVSGCSFKFGATGDRVSVGARTRFQNITTLLASGSVTSTALLVSQNASVFEAAGVDFSPIGSGTLVGTASVGCQFSFTGCKLGSSTVLSATPSAGFVLDAINCDSAATDYQKARYAYAGTLTTETAVVRTSGAVVDVTHVSDKIVTNVNTSWINPFSSIPLAVWSATTGSSVTVTVYGVYNGAALPNNDEIWMEVEYPGSASSPLASIATTTKANAMTTAAAAASDTSAWDSVATARANSTAYALGDARSVSSNTGRIFFCTTAGTSSGSLPAGYASAVDGGSVTDGTAVFRAGERFKLTSTFTPQLAGPVYVRPKAGRVSSTYYIDPLPVLS